ncbi:hypothetical protein ACIGW3_05730 [Streptomyces sp. NPDC053499]|uniref:hypothetical protein n=1 Tax=Streptomyces sp. NPDC053499 TaxID=3365707 RepID=UPI0037D09F54
MVAWLVFGVLLVLVIACITHWTSKPSSRKARSLGRGAGYGYTGQAWTAGDGMDHESGGGEGGGGDSGGSGASCGGGGASCGGGGGGGF